MKWLIFLLLFFGCAAHGPEVYQMTELRVLYVTSDANESTIMKVTVDGFDSGGNQVSRREAVYLPLDLPIEIRGKFYDFMEYVRK